MEISKKLRRKAVVSATIIFCLGLIGAGLDVALWRFEKDASFVYHLIFLSFFLVCVISVPVVAVGEVRNGFGGWSFASENTLKFIIVNRCIANYVYFDGEKIKFRMNKFVLTKNHPQNYIGDNVLCIDGQIEFVGVKDFKCTGFEEEEETKLDTLDYKFLGIRYANFTEKNDAYFAEFIIDSLDLEHSGEIKMEFCYEKNIVKFDRIYGISKLKDLFVKFNRIF